MILSKQSLKLAEDEQEKDMSKYSDKQKLLELLDNDNMFNFILELSKKYNNAIN